MLWNPIILQGPEPCLLWIQSAMPCLSVEIPQGVPTITPEGETPLTAGGT